MGSGRRGSRTHLEMFGGPQRTLGDV
jgi:hypothetical protein